MKTATTFEDRLRTGSTQFLHLFEAGLYISVGLLLAIAAIAAVVDAAMVLWHGVVGRTIANYGVQSLDQLLLVLMLVEILHTVQISIRSQSLMMEPFLIVGLIATIRRVLVITMQAAKLTEQSSGQSQSGSATDFQHTMIELGLLALLILVISFSIHILRTNPPREKLHSVKEPSE